MTDRIKLEDMTLGQIKELKSKICEDVISALNHIVAECKYKYNCGEVLLNVDTEITPPLEMETGDDILPAQAFYNIEINFSKEKDE